MSPRWGLAILTCFACFPLFGCQAIQGLLATPISEENGRSDRLTAHVGHYPPPNPGQRRVKVGVQAFAVNPNLRFAKLGEQAADQLVSLASNTERFDVIERNQLQQLLTEQQLEGIVRQGELAQPANISGVHYLFFGTVSNFRVKAENTSGGLTLGRVPGLDQFGRIAKTFDFNNTASRITVDCGVDLRLVDPSTGVVLASHFGEYQRTDSIGSFGVSLLGYGVREAGEFDITEESQGKILRLALDECVRKMLPRVDRELAARVGGEVSAAMGVRPVDNEQASGAIYCGGCSHRLEGAAKFCTGFGKLSSNPDDYNIPGRL